MRVGIVAMSRPALGGTFQYTRSVIEALRRLDGVSPTLLVARGNESYADLEVPIANLPGIPTSLWRRATRCLGSVALPDRFLDFDVLLAPIYTTRLLLYGRPFVFTLHDLQERYFPEYFSFAQRLWRAWSNRVLTQRAAGVICESNHVRLDIEKFLHVDASRIFVIPGPPASELLSANVDERALSRVKALLSLPDEYVLYPAQFFPHKNHVNLVRALALVGDRFPRAHLIFTGDRRYEYRRVFSCAERLGVSERVRHVGYLDTASLAAVYRMAKCIAIPTLFESISIPMYEAFALGVPVCISDVAALPEQAGGAALLFDPRSADDIAEKLASLLGDSALRRSLVERGRARVLALSMDAYSKKLRELLVSVGRDKTPPR